jgi:hypothetical protein
VNRSAQSLAQRNRQIFVKVADFVPHETRVEFNEPRLLEIVAIEDELEGVALAETAFAQPSFSPFAWEIYSDL